MTSRKDSEMNEAITKFRQYLQNRYPESSTTKHYMSDLSIFSKFAGDVSRMSVDLEKSASSRKGYKLNVGTEEDTQLVDVDLVSAVVCRCDSGSGYQVLR